ncbi:MAG: endonuclease/exonuclease/phosphatase family protein [Bacteroidales bacterium]|nr:endonuclease/exonuclease/phosphatase family protein [Bacteroidales bacterium]
MKYFFIAFLFSCTIVHAQDDVLPLRIVTYNIQHGAGMDDVIDLDRQAKVIGDVLPDVVGLQEVDSCVKRSNRVHQAAVLAKSLGMYSTFGPAIPLTGGKYGVAILSREEPLSHRNIPLPGNEKRTLLVCEFQEYVFACTHLALEEENRLASLDIIMEEAARWDKPFIICGDWNDQPSSPLITKMKKSFVFLSNITNNSTNYTFPARTPNRIIDYVASYGRVIKSIRKRQVLNAPEASDHRPVLVELTLPRYTTAIAEIQDSRSKIQDSGFKIQDSSSTAYDLSGRKVNPSHLPQPSSLNPPPSLYILNNKKYYHR